MTELRLVLEQEPGYEEKEVAAARNIEAAVEAEEDTSFRKI